MATSVGLTDWIYTIIRCPECFTQWAVVPFSDCDAYFNMDGDMTNGYKVSNSGAICPTCPNAVPDVLDRWAVRTSKGQWIPVPPPPAPAFGDDSAIGTLPVRPRG